MAGRSSSLKRKQVHGALTSRRATRSSTGNQTGPQQAAEAPLQRAERPIQGLRARSLLPETTDEVRPPPLFALT